MGGLCCQEIRGRLDLGRKVLFRIYVTILYSRRALTALELFLLSQKLHIIE
jgi:hypothetical protein